MSFEIILRVIQNESFNSVPCALNNLFNIYVWREFWQISLRDPTKVSINFIEWLRQTVCHPKIYTNLPINRKNGPIHNDLFNEVPDWY